MAIIGAGPAGSFSAHFLLKQAFQRGISLEVALYDGKSFTRVGRPGCNMCAGVLGSNLLTLLERERMSLPEFVIRHNIKGYAFHAGGTSVDLTQERLGPIYTVYRGGGLQKRDSKLVSFDQFLLNHAMGAGARFLPYDVEEINLPSRHGGKALIVAGRSREEYDYVIGAFGVNSNLSHRFFPGYSPPSTWSACQAEIRVDPEFLRNKYRDMIHIFSMGGQELRFIAFIPKKEFVTVSAIGRDVTLADLQVALKSPFFEPYLPEDWRISCHCHPKLPVTRARLPFNKGIIMVGDACNSRYMKNGIESAFFTSQFAAETLMDDSIPDEKVGREYFKRCHRQFDLDNLCGKSLFALNDFISSRPKMAHAHLMLLKRQQLHNPGKVPPLSEMLWHTFTGDAPYKQILKEGMQFLFHGRMVYESTRTFLAERADDEHRHAVLTHMAKRELDSGRTIAVVGGGPGGSCCSIKLLLEAKKRGRNIRVIIYEGKDFARHYNQCAGVLSPPLEEILLSELDLSLPHWMIKRDIEGYVLHSDVNEVFLPDPSGKRSTHTVRRVHFDKFLLDKARELGAEIVQSRVGGLEFIGDHQTGEVRIYSEGGYQRADVVVGAFGMDGTLLEQLEKATRGFAKYHRPRKFLRTFVTKLHTDLEFIEKVMGNRILAFLLSSLPEVEFGAIVPKGDHMVVTIAGSNISSLDMDNFLNAQQVARYLPPDIPDKLNYFQGLFPTAPARNACGPGYFTVGDATGWMRPFKGKGINVACITGIEAAKAMMEFGLTDEAREYYVHTSEKLRQDYSYGVMVRRACNMLNRRGLFDPIIELAKSNPRLCDILYGAVSGEESYKSIVSELLTFDLTKELAATIGKKVLVP